MKALIIDDEPHVLMVARLLVDWSAYGIDLVLESESAEAAMEIIQRENPEIILSDINLPGLSGLDLIQSLRDRGMDSQVVLITAYGDFTYAQKAVQLGCVDYLLKPLAEKSLNQAVQKAVHLYNENQHMRTNASHIRIRDLLSIYLGQRHSAEVFSELSELVPGFQGMETCRVGIICIRHLPYNFSSRFKLMEAVQRILDEDLNGAVCRWRSEKDLILLMKDRGEETIALCQGILQTLRDVCGLWLPMGLSNPERFSDNLDEACHQAEERVMSRDILSYEEGIALMSEGASQLLPFETISQILRAAFFVGNASRRESMVKDLVEYMMRPGTMTLHNIEAFRSIYNTVRMQCTLVHQRENGLESISPDAFTMRLFAEDGRFSAEYMAKILLDDMIRLEQTYSVDTKHLTIHEICVRVERYLEAHYAEEINLDFLAARFGVSAGHLSRSYKREMGIGLVDALNQIRIEQSCLFLQGDMKLADIASAVGFSDPKYFSRVFKKIRGVSPAEYRESRR